MIVRTEALVELLNGSDGVIRDENAHFGSPVASYRENGGLWTVLDESSEYTETSFFIEDCVRNECFRIAAAVDKWVKGKKS